MNYVPDYDKGMDYRRTNHKRSNTTYNDVDTSKRRKVSDDRVPSPLFLSDDEDDAFIDEDLFGGDTDSTPAMPHSNGQHATMPRELSYADPTPNQSANLNQEGSSVDNDSHLREHLQGFNTGTLLSATATMNNVRMPTTNSSHADSTSAASFKEVVEVKDEPDDELAKEPDWLQNTPNTDRIRLYVGKKNRQVFVKRSDLAKSPILTSYIIEPDNDPDPGQSTPYIMRPQLLKMDFNDFSALVQFLHSGEYEPMLVEAEGSAEKEYVLDGFSKDRAYSTELVRAGRIYVIAQMFKVEGLEEVVFGKITKVNERKYSIKSLVELAGVVFSDKRSDIGGVSTNNGKDKLETWIIGQFAKNLQEIMKTQHDEFWAVEKKTSKKMFLAQVLEETADRYRALGGKLPGPVVELD